MKIILTNGPGEGKAMEFALQEITIGREQGNILRLPAEGVSRFHAKISRKEDGTWWIQDQNSTNGVKINGSRICGEEKLSEGDEVTIGEQTLRVSDLNGAPPKVVFRPIVSPTTGEIPFSGKDTGFGAAPGTTVLNPVDDIGEKFDAQKVKHALLGGNIFSGRGKKNGTPESSGPSEEKRRRFAMLFYTVIGVCAAVVILSVIFGRKPEAPRTPVSVAADNCSIRFEKMIFQKDNIFRFAASIEGNVAEFSIDDIKSRRHFSRRIENPRGLELLRPNIRSTGISRCSAAPEPGSDSAIRRRIWIADLREAHEVEAWGEYPHAAVLQVEDYIRNFAELHGLHSISLTSEELRQQADEIFSKAEDLFGNREANLRNLRDAILRYRVVISALEQFAKPPPKLGVARSHLAEAERIRNHKLSQFRYEESRCLGLGDEAALRQIYQQVMELADPDSREYQEARKRLFILDRNPGRNGR